MSVRAGPAPAAPAAPAAREEAAPETSAPVSRLAQVLAAGMRVSFDPSTKQATVAPTAPTGRPKSDPGHELVEPYRSERRPTDLADRGENRQGCRDRAWQTADSQRRNPGANDYRPRNIYRWEPDRVYTKAMRARGIALPYQVPSDFDDVGGQVRPPNTSAEALVRYVLEAIGASPLTAAASRMMPPDFVSGLPNDVPFPKIYLVDGSNVFHTNVYNEREKAINRVSYFANNPEHVIASYFRRRTLVRNAFFHMSKYGEQPLPPETPGTPQWTQWQDTGARPSNQNLAMSAYRTQIRSKIADVLDDTRPHDMVFGLDGFLEDPVTRQPILAFHAPVILLFNEKSYNQLIDSAISKHHWDLNNAYAYREWGYTISPPGGPGDKCDARKKYYNASAGQQGVFNVPRDSKGVSMFYRVLEATAVMHNWTHPVIFLPIQAEQKTAAHSEGDRSTPAERAKIVKYEQGDLDDGFYSRRSEVDDRETLNNKSDMKKPQESKCEFRLPHRYDPNRKTGTTLSHGWCEWDDCILSRMRDHLDELGFSVDCISADTNVYKTDAPFADGDIPDYELPGPGVQKSREDGTYNDNTAHDGPGLRPGCRPLLYPTIARKHFFDEFEKHMSAVVSDGNLQGRYKGQRQQNGFGVDEYTVQLKPNLTIMQKFRLDMADAWENTQARQAGARSDSGARCESDFPGLRQGFAFALPRKRFQLTNIAPISYRESIEPDEQVLHIYGNADRALYYLALLSQAHPEAKDLDGTVLSLGDPANSRALEDYSPDPYPNALLLPGFARPGDPQLRRMPEPWYNSGVDFGASSTFNDELVVQMRSCTAALQAARPAVADPFYGTLHPGIKGADFRANPVKEVHNRVMGVVGEMDFSSEIKPADIVAAAQGFSRAGGPLQSTKLLSSRFENCLLLQHELLRDRLVMLRDAANYMNFMGNVVPLQPAYEYQYFWQAVQIANRECSMLKLDALRDAATAQSGGESARARIRLQQEMAEMRSWLAEKRYQPFPNTPITNATGQLREPDKRTARQPANTEALGSFTPAARDAFLRTEYTVDDVTRLRTERQDALAIRIDELNQLEDIDDPRRTFFHRREYINRLTREQQDQLFEAHEIDEALCPPIRIH